MKPARLAALALGAWTGAALADPAPIAFNGVDFIFHNAGKINNGWGVYYAPFGQDPEQSADELIVNYLDKTDGQGHAITAQGMAEAMLDSIKSRGAKVILPFAAPDPAYNGRLSYYLTFYYIYPEVRDGDLWYARVIQDDDRALGILFKHRIAGTSPEDVEAKILAWIKDNLNAIPIDTIKPPPEPPHG